MMPMWAILMIVCALIWACAILWPMPTSGGSYDFGGLLLMLLRIALAAVVCLVIWVVYALVLVAGRH